MGVPSPGKNRDTPKMPINTLTNTGINAAKPCEKPYKLSDGGGMYLLVNPKARY